MCDSVGIKRNVLKAHLLFRVPTMSVDWPVGAVLCDNTETLLVLNSVWYVRTFSENLSLSQVVWEMLERVNATTGVLQPGTIHYPTVQQTRLLSDKLVARMANTEGEEKNGGKEEWRRNSVALSQELYIFSGGGGLDGGWGGGGIICSWSQLTQIVEKQFEHDSDVEVERRPKGTPWQFFWLKGGIDSLILSSHMK